MAAQVMILGALTQTTNLRVLWRENANDFRAGPSFSRQVAIYGRSPLRMVDRYGSRQRLLDTVKRRAAGDAP